MQEIIEMLLKKIEELEKKVERYYKLLKIKNELDFVMKGSYLTDKDINKIMNGGIIEEDLSE